MDKKLVFEFKWKEVLLIGPFLLYFLSIGSISYYIIPVVLILFFIVTINNLKYLVDFDFLILTLFSILYNLFNKATSNQDLGFLRNIELNLFPSIFFILGKIFSKRVQDERDYIKFVMILTFIFFVLPFVSNLISIINNGYMATREVPLLLASNESDNLAATIMASYFSLNMAFFPLLFTKFQVKEKINYRIIFTLFFIIGLICVSNLISRTGFIISIISLIVVFTLIPLSNKLKFLLNFLITLTIITILLILFGLFDFIENSELYFRFFIEVNQEEGLASERSDIWVQAFDILTNGNNSHNDHESLEDFKFAHNLWLDIALKAGFLPFLLMVIFVFKFMFMSYKKYFKFVNLTSKIILINIVIAFVVTFMVEPIMDGYFTYFCFFCLLFGFLKALRINRKSTLNLNKSL